MARIEDGQPTVVVDRVSRKFEVSVARPAADSLGGRVANALTPRPTVTVQALRAVSFTANAGETIGLLGTNGSGKSTLLRLIAGLDVPTRGSVTAVSQPLLLGVGAALQPGLSGLDNARLGLLAMGFKPRRVAATLPRVLELANIGEAVERPIGTYSSGMASRLRFAIAAAAEPEILLLDEVLATGDAASVQRAEARMDEIRSRAGTVFLVSHTAQTIEETCTRGLWLHEGVLIQDGPAVSTARAYRRWAWKVAQGDHEAADRLLRESMGGGQDASTVLDVTDDTDKAPPWTAADHEGAELSVEEWQVRAEARGRQVHVHVENLPGSMAVAYYLYRGLDIADRKPYVRGARSTTFDNVPPGDYRVRAFRRLRPGSAVDTESSPTVTVR